MDSPQEVDSLEEPGCPRLLPPHSAADLAHLTRGFPALRMKPLSATADTLAASRQEVLVKQVERLEALSAADLLEVPHLADVPSADLLAATEAVVAPCHT